MTRTIDIVHEGRVSRFVVRPIQRKSLLGFKRCRMLDEQGNECASALLTHEGGFVLPAGSTTEMYLDAKGDAVKRADLRAVDHDGKPLPTLPARNSRPHVLESRVTLDAFLDHVMTHIHALETDTLDPSLDAALRGGAIFQIPYRPRPTPTETLAFLLANEHGFFLVQAEPCRFEYVGLDQAISDSDAPDEYDDEFDDDDAFVFHWDMETDHALA